MVKHFSDPQTYNTLVGIFPQTYNTLVGTLQHSAKSSSLTYHPILWRNIFTPMEQKSKIGDNFGAYNTVVG